MFADFAEFLRRIFDRGSLLSLHCNERKSFTAADLPTTPAVAVH
jgi:hypothetical protein